MHLTFSLKSVSKSYFIRKVIPTRHSGNHAAYTYSTSPAMFFHFLSPGVGRNMQDRPAWLPEYPAAPFHATAIPGRRPGCRVLRQRYHYHPDFQGSLPTLPHAGNAAHIFPSSVTIPRSTCVKVLPHTSLQANISPRSSPLIIFQCSECFVFLHTDIQFRQIKNAETFVVKVHSLPRDIYLHSNLPFRL